jgi:FkbM family methyltransferase
VITRATIVHALKWLTVSFPASWQHTIKRCYFARQIRRGTFRSNEPEYELLDELLSPGDWVIDVGANVGHYTLRMSELVKTHGRVVAMEPIPLTFDLLTANCACGRFKNVTLLNVAASISAGIVTMVVPGRSSAGLPNYYEARIAPESTCELCYAIMAIRIDTIDIPKRVRLVKVDAEGHELSVIEGMSSLLKRDFPVIVVEGSRASPFLESLGYKSEHYSGSPNYVWRHDKH